MKTAIEAIEAYRTQQLEKLRENYHQQVGYLFTLSNQTVLRQFSIFYEQIKGIFVHFSEWLDPTKLCKSNGKSQRQL